MLIRDFIHHKSLFIEVYPKGTPLARVLHQLAGQMMVFIGLNVTFWLNHLYLGKSVFVYIFCSLGLLIWFVWYSKADLVRATPEQAFRFLGEWMVQNFRKRHPDFDEVIDAATNSIRKKLDEQKDRSRKETLH